MLVGRPRRGRPGQLPAPAAAARSRTRLGVGDFRAAAGLRRRTPRSRPPGKRPWHRALIYEDAPPGSTCRRTWSAPDTPCSPRPAANTSPGAHTPKSTNSTGHTRRCEWERGGITQSAPDRAPDDLPQRPGRPPTHPAPPLDLLGILAASQALSSATSIPGPTRPGRPSTGRHDRCHPRPPPAVER